MNAFANDLQAGFEILWYQIQSVLGRGGFGITYLAKDTNLGHLVAIKEYLPDDYATRRGDSTVQPVSVAHNDVYAWGLDRFMSEAKTLGKFKHSNIVRVLSVFKFNNTGYMVMEYEQGQDLSAIYKEQITFTQFELENIYYPIIEGLKCVHHEGFIHRDIKPANIFIRADGTPVLLDFGAARQAVGSKTKTLTAMLSIGYSPLEQYNDMPAKQGPWTDIYSIGASLYQGITGNKPLESTIRGMALVHNEPDPYEPLSQSRFTDYSLAFLRAVDRALMLQITDRPQSLEEFLAMLRGDIFLPGLPVNKSIHEKTVIRPKGYVFLGRNNGGQKNDNNPQNTFEGEAVNPKPEARPVDLSSGSKNPAKKMIFVFSLIALAASAFLYLSTKLTPEEIQQQKIVVLLENAEAFINSGHYYGVNQDNALSRFNQVLRLDAENSFANKGVISVANYYLKQAEQYIALKEHSKASASLKIVADIKTDFPGLKEAKNKIALSIAQEKKSLKIAILFSSAKQSLSKNHLYNPEQNSALAHYKKILMLESKNLEAKIGIDKIADIVIIDTEKALRIKNYKRVEELLKLATSLNPDNPDILSIKKQIAYNSKLENMITKADKAYSKQQYIIPKSNNAVDLYKRVLKLSPGNYRAIQRLDSIADSYAKEIRTSLRSGQLVAAKNTFNIIKSYLPDYSGLKRLNHDIVLKQKEQTPISISNKGLKKESVREKQRLFNSIQHLIPVDINQNQDDSRVVQKIVADFQKYFQNRDIHGLKKIAVLDAQSEAFYIRVFNSYKKFNLKVFADSFKLTGDKGVATVTLQITDLIDSRGKPVETTAIWTKINLRVIKKENYWLRAELTG